MIKEMIISIIIVIVIIFGNSITQGYTSDCVNILTNDLMSLREELIKDGETEDNKMQNEQIDEIYEKWKGMHDKLAYYIEHDELEKVETNITALKSFIEIKEYSEAVKELDSSVFVLKHIEDKYDFNLQNIF